MVYTSASAVDFRASDAPALPRPGRALFVAPTFFDVQYVINPHMEGNIGSVNAAEAGQQWRRLRDTYESLGFQPTVIQGAEGLPDMVFCANQTLPFYRPSSGGRGVVLSRMNAAQRRDEVAYFARFFSGQGFEVLTLDSEGAAVFEGMGDAIWHPGRHLLWGGYGFRTSLEVYDEISRRLDVRVLALRLEDPAFYHLDTCFSVLNERSVLVYPGAFDAEGIGLIQHFFEQVIEAPEHEARRLFACNAHCPDGKNVLIQRGCTDTVQRLAQAGFTAREVDTDEFLKSGGSVFCMKLMYW